MRPLAIALSLVLAAPLPAQTLEATPPPNPRDVTMSVTQANLPDWIAAFRHRALAAGVSAATFDTAMKGRHIRADVLQSDRNQTEFNKPIWSYLDTALSRDRVARGRKALRQDRALLSRIEAAYGVDADILAGIWGLESNFGAVKGDIPTLDALITLAADTRRGRWFEGELISALKIVQAGDATADQMTGSWAGAMGHTQFMPSTYLHFAVDFDHDGKRDIWGKDPTDALASAAAYLAHWGWKKGQPVAVQVHLPGNFDYMLAGVYVTKPVSAWQKLGIAPLSGALPAARKTSVLLPAGARGPAFLIYPNFHVVEHYNPADAYVLAVAQLASRIAGGGPIRGSWPRELRALDYNERVALQRGLTAAGFSTRGVDGLVGPNTIAALRRWQKAQGDLPDGFPTPAILARLGENKP